MAGSAERLHAKEQDLSDHQAERLSVILEKLRLTSLAYNQPVPHRLIFHLFSAVARPDLEDRS